MNLIIAGILSMAFMGFAGLFILYSAADPVNSQVRVHLHGAAD
jgi:hypothetical protein